MIVLFMGGLGFVSKGGFMWVRRWWVVGGWEGFVMIRMAFFLWVLFLELGFGRLGSMRCRGNRGGLLDGVV
jgi:hypothetical protein